MIDSFHEMTKSRFSSPEEVRKHHESAHLGLMAWERAVVDRYLHSPGRVLDIGCGGGREAIALQRLGCSVTGIDISAAQVESAKAMAAQVGLSIDFEVCSGDRLEFCDSSFDYVIIWGQALGNVATHTSRVQLLRDCVRVTRPGGKLVFSVHNRHACEPVVRQKKMMQMADGEVLEHGDFILKGDSESDSLCYWHYFDKDEILRLCDQSGWMVIECDLAKEFGQADWETVWVCVAENSKLTGARGAGTSQ